MVAKGVGITYGPKGKNVLIEKTYGKPTLTRDGVTVAREIYFQDRPVNVGAGLVLEASETTNRVAGDGTTATVVLTYNLMKYGFQQVAAGQDPMEIRRQLQKDSYLLLDKIKDLSNKVKKGQLLQVATISSGDDMLGKLISEAIEYVGPDGGLITEKAHISGVEREYVDGYYLQQGFSAITEGRRQIDDCMVIVSSKHLTAATDIKDILNKMADQGLITNTEVPRVAFFGEIEGDAYNTIVANVIQGTINAVVIKTPPMGDMGVQYLEDLAIYTGGRLIAEGDNISNFSSSSVGNVKKVVATPYATTLFSGDSIAEDLDSRVRELKDRLKVEEIPQIAEKIQDRLAKLQGKIALFRIGGATDTEKDEKEFRIEDAIQSTKAAYSQGVVAGAGVTLIELAKEPISDAFKEALMDSAKKLLSNAGLNAETNSIRMAEAGYPMGYNLRDGGDLTDVIAEGILDPTLVVEQIVENAASAAGNALTTGLTITFKDRDDTPVKP